MRLKIVLIFCVGFLSGCSGPSFQFVDGQLKDLSDYKGQWLLINYWASWCKPCITEIPELNLLHQRPDIHVLAFNFDRLDAQDLNREVAKFSINYPSLAIDPGEMFKQPAPGALPATMVIDPKGRFRQWLYGEQSQSSILKVLKD